MTRNTAVVDLTVERSRRRPEPQHQPTARDAIRALLELRADADVAQFLDSDDVIAKLAPVWSVVFKSLPRERRNQL